ncbi:hypothetical protein NL342_27580, partial [Klebsiella pneumoniae]|nr:hypothetical protein [Klebsiella pneumoniae]
TAGARVAARTYPGPLGRALAAVIAGHHAGLGDAHELDRRLDPAHVIPDFAGWEAVTSPLPPIAALRPNRELVPNDARGFGLALLTRMLFSCL